MNARAIILFSAIWFIYDEWGNAFSLLIQEEKTCLEGGLIVLPQAHGSNHPGWDSNH
jgi:hypothetical protein